MKKKKLLEQFLVLGIFFGVLFVLQVFMVMGGMDDAVYVEVWNEKPLDVFLHDRYIGWSSRIVIEAVMMPLIAMNPWVWRILNILVVLLLVWNTADLFSVGNRLQAQVMLFGLMWGIPLASLHSAGWITTTTNYMWVLVLGLVAVRPVKHWVMKEKISRWEYAVCPLCIIYAANMEQMGAVLLGVYILFGIYLFVEERKLSPFYFVQMLLVVLSLVLILAAPGNVSRNLYESGKYFPEFLNLSLGEKLLMGFLETAHYYLAAGDKGVSYLVPLLSGVLLAMTVCRGRKGERGYAAKLLVALLPLAFYWGIGHLGNWMLAEGMFPVGGHWIGVLGMNRQLPGLGTYSVFMVSVQAAVYLFLIGCIAFSVYFLHGKSKETLLQLVILGAGLLSRVIIGLSPTIYASGDRTAIFCSMAVLIVTLRNLQFYFRMEQGRIWKWITGGYLGAVILCNLF